MNYNTEQRSYDNNMLVKIQDKDIKKIIAEYGYNPSSDDYIKMLKLYYSTDLEDQNKFKKFIKLKLDEKYDEIKKIASKFAKKIMEKKPDEPLHKVLEIGKKISQKYDITGQAYDEFNKILEMILQDREPKSFKLETLMGKLFGKTGDVYNGLFFNDSEKGYVQDILKYYAQTKNLHSSLFNQTVTYRDMDRQSLIGEFSKIHHDINTHVHPVLAALYIPKIKILEYYTIFSNLSYILKQVYKKEKIKHFYDRILLDSITNDNQDVVCSMKSPLADYKNRILLQIELWNSVLALRQGKYYEKPNTNFLQQVDNCKINEYDYPEFMNSYNEDVVLKRLLSAFCLKPIVYSYDQNPLLNVINMNNYDRKNHGIHKNISHKSMLTMKIPLNRHNKSDMIRDNLELSDVFNENVYDVNKGMLVEKNMVILHIREMLIIHVPRRKYGVRKSTEYEPMFFNKTPNMMMGLEEEVNDFPVDFDHHITIPSTGRTLNLRSIVSLNVMASEIYDKAVVRGCVSYLLPVDDRLDLGTGRGTPLVIEYNPLVDLGNVDTNVMTEYPLNGEGSVSEYCKRYGTIFVYLDPDYYSNQY